MPQPQLIGPSAGLWFKAEHEYRVSMITILPLGTFSPFDKYVGFLYQWLQCQAQSWILSRSECVCFFSGSKANWTYSGSSHFLTRFKGLRKSKGGLKHVLRDTGKLTLPQIRGGLTCRQPKWGSVFLLKMRVVFSHAHFYYRSYYIVCRGLGMRIYKKTTYRRQPSFKLFSVCFSPSYWL